MTPFITHLVALAAVGTIFFANALFAAPQGWEDTDGWHPGDQFAGDGDPDGFRREAESVAVHGRSRTALSE